MKRLKLSLVVLLLSSLAFVQVGCNDDTPVQGTPQKDPVKEITSSVEIEKMMKDLAPEVQTFTKDASSYFVVKGKKGFELVFNGNSFVDASGNAVTGNVEVSLTEITTVAEMLASGVTTTSGNTLLSSGGMFNVEVRQNGNLLSLKTNGQYEARIPDNGNPDFNMQIFEGEKTGNVENAISWNENKDSWINRQDSGRNDSMYNLNLKFLSWCNLDKYYDKGIDVTNIAVKLPSDYTNSNTQVFIFIEKDQASVRLYGDSAKKEFNCGSYKIPVGFKIKVVVVAEIDKKLYYKIVSATVTKDHVVTINKLTAITKEDLEIELKKLK